LWTEVEPTTAPRRVLWALVLAGTAVSLAVSVRIAAGTLVLGSASGRWVYQYLYGFRPHALAVFGVVAGCCIVAAMVPLGEVRRRQWLVIVMWLVVGGLSQAVLRQLTPYSLEQMFVSEGSDGFYTAASQHGPADLLRNFDRLRPTFGSVHARSNMPGKLLLVHAMERVSSNPAVLAWLVVLLSNLGGVLLYVFVRDLLADRETALASLILYLFVPAKLVFFPVLNTLTPVLLLGCAWLWMRLIRSHAIAYAVASGVAIFGVALYEPTPLVAGVLFGVLTAQALWRGDIGWRSAASRTGIVALAFLATYTVFLAAFRFDLFATLRAIARDAIDFNASGNRPYAIWVPENLFDFLFGMGVCQALIFCWSAASAMRRGRLAARGAAGAVSAFALGTAATLVVADLLGINRGEVVRLWIFLACLAQVPAAYVCARLGSRAALMVVLSATLLQVALSTSMLAFAQP